MGLFLPLAPNLGEIEKLLFGQAGELQDGHERTPRHGVVHGDNSHSRCTPLLSKDHRHMRSTLSLDDKASSRQGSNDLLPREESFRGHAVTQSSGKTEA